MATIGEEILTNYDKDKVPKTLGRLYDSIVNLYRSALNHYNNFVREATDNGLVTYI